VAHIVAWLRTGLTPFPPPRSFGSAPTRRSRHTDDRGLVLEMEALLSASMTIAFGLDCPLPAAHPVFIRAFPPFHPRRTTMKALLSYSLLIPLAACALRAQDVLYYKLDETGGRKVVNYASATGIAPTEGEVMGPGTPVFVPGALGVSALAGSTAQGSVYIASGWSPNFTGSFSVGFFMKQCTAPSSVSYLFSSSNGNGVFRMFTGSSAGRGISTAAAFDPSGLTNNLNLGADVQTMAASAWLHIALVVDAAILTAQYYVNGAASGPPIAIPVGGANIVAGTFRFNVAGYVLSGGDYDIDEFRFTRSAASASQVATWAARTSPADGAYGAGCNGATLRSTGGAPQLGNAAYALHIAGNAGGAFALGIGTNRLRLGGVGLPFDLGVVLPALNGCNWESSGELFLGGAVGGAGVTLPVPIPNVRSLNGAVLWNQALVIGGGPDQSTNGFSFGIGQ